MSQGMHAVKIRQKIKAKAALPLKVKTKGALKRQIVLLRPTPKSGVVPTLVPLVRSMGYHVRELSESWTAAMDTAAEAKGISLTQWRYLRELWEADRLSIGDLTMRVGRQGPTTVMAVRSLEKAGLARIEKSGHDRRKTFICLTTRGRRLAEIMAPLIRTINEAAVAELTAEEIRVFKQVLVKIQRKLDRESPSRTSWSILRTEHLAREIGA